MLEVYAVKQVGNIDMLKLKELLVHISEERRKRAKRFLKKEDVYRSIVGELLIRKIISKKLNIANKDISFNKNDYGKPFLKGYDDFRFNLSHSGKWIVCAVSKREVGIDIEEIKQIELDIAQRFFSEKEYRELIKREDRLDYFYELWTLKESYIKAVGKGLSIRLDSFTITIDKQIISLESEITKRPYSFKQYKIDKKYKMAVCSVGKIKKDKLKILSSSQVIKHFITT